LVWGAVAVLAAVVALRASSLLAGAERRAPTVGVHECGFGTFGPGNWPPACWRPYSAASPFNQPLPENARERPDSAALVGRLLSFGPLQHLTAGVAETARDDGKPTYFSGSADPVYRVHCTAPWGRCPLEGRRVRVPAAAVPAGGEDAHMTIIDQRTGWEDDLWHVRDKPRRAGTLTIGWGGRLRIDGNGLGSDAVAARYGAMAGQIRAEELDAGAIEHALFLVVRCDSGQFVYPAAKSGRSCGQAGQPVRGAPPMGTRFQLAMSPEEIDALPVPDYKKTILRAMARYGMFVGDTGGTWSVKTESGTMYTSLGYEDRWVALARRLGVPYYRPHHLFVFDLRSGVDWPRYLRVIDPCVSRGTC
jgi:hypothetical protein